MKTTLSLLLKKRGFFLLTLSLFLTPTASVAQADTKAVADAAIIPWLGIWTAIDETPSSRTTVIEISPGADGRGFEITTKDTDPPVSENIIPDGILRRIEFGNCTGSNTYKWEKEAGVLLGTSEIVCGEASYSIITLKMMTSADRMTDILAVKTADQTRLAVRRFAFEREFSSAVNFFLGQESMLLRTTLAAPWDLDKIINLSQIVETSVLEAALIEKNLQVKLDAKSLRKMKSTGTPDSIIDLLVAMSNPDKFRIEKNEHIAVEAASRRPESGETYSYSYGIEAPYYYGYYYPWSYYWSYNSPFWWGYPIYMYPMYPYYNATRGGGSGNGSGNGGGGSGGGRPDSHLDGRLSSGSGYVQITPRDTGSKAVPRGSAAPGAYATGSSAGYVPGVSAVSAGSGSAGNGSAVGTYSSGVGAVSSGPSASPSGYSGGGNNGTAVPR